MTTRPYALRTIPVPYVAFDFSNSVRDDYTLPVIKHCIVIISSAR